MITAAERPDQVALRTPDDEISLTFGALQRRLAATASILCDLGLRNGEALGLCASACCRPSGCPAATSSRRR